jgi:hypothetical protein
LFLPTLRFCGNYCQFFIGHYRRSIGIAVCFAGIGCAFGGDVIGYVWRYELGRRGKEFVRSDNGGGTATSSSSTYLGMILPQQIIVRQSIMTTTKTMKVEDETKSISIMGCIWLCHRHWCLLVPLVVPPYHDDYSYLFYVTPSQSLSTSRL